jgi:hypothetical protein
VPFFVPLIEVLLYDRFRSPGGKVYRRESRRDRVLTSLFILQSKAHKQAEKKKKKKNPVRREGVGRPTGLSL